MIAGARFDATGYAWRGSTLCVLALHPAGQSIPAAMKRGDWWITKGQEMRRLRIGVGEGNCPPLAQRSEIQASDMLNWQAQRHRPTTTTGNNVDHEAEPIPSDVIRLLIHENPKRGKSRLRFDCYYDGITFADYEKAVLFRLGEAEARKCKADLKWDSDQKRRLIRIERDGKPLELSIPSWLQHP